MNRLLMSIVFSPIGYVYMRVRYGRYHKRQLILKYARSYKWAGMTAVWVPFLAIVIVIVGWALLWVAIGIIRN